MRVTNIDTISAFFDRLITENIKAFFFAKEGNEEKLLQQDKIIKEIKSKLSVALKEAFEEKYEYLSERRTFNESAIIEQLDELTKNDILIGEADRARLKQLSNEIPELSEFIRNEKILRKANEGRSRNKNNIDQLFTRE